MAVREVEALPDGRRVHLVELGQEPGPVLRLLTLGATVHDLEVTGGDGVRRHVVLGLARVADQLTTTGYVGGTVGRYANRIRDGHLPLPDGTHRLAVNDRGHHLHGGPVGFDKRVWDLADATATTATLTLRSEHGDQGHPGTVDVVAAFEVGADTVRMTLTATTDRTTVVNPTQHAYWNLEGRDAGPVTDHLLAVHASRWTPVDATGIPDGAPAPVAGTPFDLRRPARLGDVLAADHPQLQAVGGLDHDFWVDAAPAGADDGPVLVATLDAPRTGTRLTVRSDRPGLQVYTANTFDGTWAAAGGGTLGRHAGVALEPQLHPDTPHHADWPSALLHPGSTYRSRTEWHLAPL